MEFREPLFTFILITYTSKKFCCQKKRRKYIDCCLLVLCLHVYIENNIHQFILGLGGCQRAKVWSCFDQEFLVCSLGWKFIQLELLCVGRPLLSTYYCSLLRREKKQGGHFQNDHTTISWNHWTIFDVPPLVDQIFIIQCKYYVYTILDSILNFNTIT